MTKLTKIVATIGPATETEEQITKLIEAGMNVARFNTKHGDIEWHQERIRRVRSIAEKMGVSVGILLDLQGPEIRLAIPGEEAFPVKADETVIFTYNQDCQDPHKPILPKIVIETLKPGDHVLIDDGLGEFAVVSKNQDELATTALGDFTINNRKTLNTPGATIDLPSLIDRDLAHLDAASDELIDFVGLSFVRNKQDIEILKSELEKRQLHPEIVAKIENQSALDHLEEIIEISDVVMIARGDLAVEVPFEELTYWQKKIIDKSRELGKPVITATQMLKSMVENPRPTRAEVSDVAHAIYDGTDAVMLSEETTLGKYPVEAVRAQAKIASFNEPHSCFQPLTSGISNTTAYITQAAINLLSSCKSTQVAPVDRIVCLTETGDTARLIARFRPDLPIYTLTSSQRTYRQLSMVYAVIPYMIKLPDDFRLASSEELLNVLKQLNITTGGEKVLLIHGTFWKKPGLTNTLSLITIP